MVLNANVILLMAAVVLALFAVVQLPKLFALLKGQKKDEMVVLAEPVKTVVVYQSKKNPKKATAKKATAPKTATKKTTHRKTTKSAGKKSPRSRKKS